MAVPGVIIFILCALVMVLNALPEVLKNPGSSVDMDSNSYAYLKFYGYIDSTTIRKGASQLKSKEGVVDAIKRFQDFVGIPKTGQLDNETMDYMKKPRCGMPDMTDGHQRRRKRRYNHQGSYWKNTHITWALENSNNDGMSRTDVRSTLSKAFQKWEAKTNVYFTELPARPKNRAKIRVRFERLDHGDEVAFDGHGGTLAHAFYPHIDHPLYKDDGYAGDVHFDDDENYTLNEKANKDEKKLLWIAVHEIGHSLGLGHSRQKGAIMFPFYQNYEGNDFDLTYDDILGIQRLYGGKRDTTPKPGHPTTTGDPLRPTKSIIPTTNKPKETTPTPTPTYPPFTIPSRPECTDRMKVAFMGTRRKLLFINNNKLYKLHYQNKEGIETGPVPISSYFRDIRYRKIDAVFRHPYYLFYYVFHGDTFSIHNCYSQYCKMRLNDGRPRNINFGFQNIDGPLRDIDAAFIWPGSYDTLYIFKGEMFWRLKSKYYDFIVEYGYPKKIAAHFRGLPKTIDTVFQWTNKKIYFTKDKLYYRWDEHRQNVRSGYPIELTRSFLNCNGS